MIVQILTYSIYVPLFSVPPCICYKGLQAYTSWAESVTKVMKNNDDRLTAFDPGQPG